MDGARPYIAADRNACLAIFDSNVPEYFSSDKRSGFETFLDDLPTSCAYQVIECDGAIVGCGGVAVEEDGCTASLCWGMIHNRRHRSGLGSALTAARLDAARAMGNVSQVRMDTSQHTKAFYNRFGFVTERIVKDGYGPGLDRCDMKLVLAECASCNIAVS